MRNNFAERATAEAVCNAKNSAALAELSTRKMRLASTTLTEDEVTTAEGIVTRARGRWPLSRIGEAGIVAMESQPVSELVEPLAIEWFALLTDETGERWRRELRIRIRRFLRDHPGLTTSAWTPALTRAWLDALPLAAQTRANLRNCLHRFGGWLVERGKTRENPAGGIRIRKRRTEADGDGTPPSVLIAAQAAAFMHACEGAECRRLLGWAALCLFAGLRPESEAPRLTWAEINLRTGEASVFGRKRGAKPRIVRLTKQARAWLRVARADGYAQPGRYWRHLRRKAVALANEALATQPGAQPIAWDEDILRHTHASFRSAAGVPVHELAEDMGTSAKAIYAYYRHPQTKAAVKLLAAIKPEKTSRR